MIQGVINTFTQFFRCLVWILNIDFGTFKFSGLVLLFFIMSVAGTIIRYFYSNWAHSVVRMTTSSRSRSYQPRPQSQETNHD